MKLLEYGRDICGHAEKFEAHVLYKFAISPNKHFTSGKQNGKPWPVSMVMQLSQVRQQNKNQALIRTAQVRSKCYKCKEHGHLSYNSP